MVPPLLYGLFDLALKKLNLFIKKIMSEKMFDKFIENRF